MELLKMANLTNKKRTDTQNEVTERLNNQTRLLQKNEQRTMQNVILWILFKLKKHFLNTKIWLLNKKIVTLSRLSPLRK